MPRVIVSGSSGRMSRRIMSLLASEKNVKVIVGIEKKNHKDIGSNLQDIVGINSKNLNGLVRDDLSEVIGTCDVIVEFTTPKVTLEHLKQAVKFKKAIVIGTTGFNKKEMSLIKKASSKIPVFFSPNMSIGVNLIFNVLEKLSRSLPLSYNVEIVETHHKFKKDAPSGTAKKMTDIIAKGRRQNLDKVVIFGRRGHTGKKPKNQICVHAIRTGSVVGRHEVKFVSDEDEILIMHNAFSRDIFAKGAISAIKFISKKKKGFYTTADLIRPDVSGLIKKRSV